MSYSESFDSTTVGQVPAGWVVDAHATVQVGTVHSAPNVLATTLDSSSAHWAYRDALDDGGGDNTYEAWVQFDNGNQIAELIYRLSPGSGIAAGTYYSFQVQALSGGSTSNGTLSRSIAGTPTTIGQATPGPPDVIPTGGPIRLRVLAVGARHRCECFLASNGTYVTPGGGTSATQQYCVDVTDSDPSAISGAGRSGVLWYQADGTTILFDDFSTTPAAAPATTYTAPASPTTILAGSTTTATVTPDAAYTGTITGTPSGASAAGLAAHVLTFSSSAAPQAASWTPTVAGTLAITWTNGGSLANPAVDTITVSPTGYTAVAAPTTVVVGSATVVTVTPGGTYSGTITLTPSGAGLSAPQTLTYSASSAAQAATFTPTSTGTLTITPSNNGGLMDPAALTVAVNPTAPGAPTGLSATAGVGLVALSWTAPASGGAVASYSVSRGTSAGGESGPPIATGLLATAYTDAAVAAGTAYFYMARSVNVTGTSAASNEATATPTAGPDPTTRDTSADFGAGYSGLSGTASYAVHDRSMSVVRAATTAGVLEVSPGYYIANFATTSPGPFYVLWSTGGAAPVQATDYLPAAVPTAIEVADAILARDWAAIGVAIPDRCALQALRFLRNSWSTAGSTLTVKAEDDATTAWTKPLTTDAAAPPVTGTGSG